MAFVWYGYIDQQKALAESILYEDKVLGYQFNYPNTWENIPADQIKKRNEKFVGGVSKRNEPSTAIGVIVLPRKSEENVDYRIISEQLEKTLAKDLTDFKKKSGREVKLSGGLKGLEIDYAFMQLGKNLVRQRQLIVITPKSTYYLSGSALIGNYNEEKKNFDLIFDSFVVN